MNNKTNITKQKGMIEIILLVLALIVIAAVAAYYFLVYKKTNTASSQLPSSQQASQKAESASTLETELNSVEINDVNTDFSDLDKELDSL